LDDELVDELFSKFSELRWTVLVIRFAIAYTEWAGPDTQLVGH